MLTPRMRRRYTARPARLPRDVRPTELTEDRVFPLAALCTLLSVPLMMQRDFCW